MKNKLMYRITLTSLLLSASAVSGTVLAQGSEWAAQASGGQVHQRLERPQERIHGGVGYGRINARQEGRDEHREFRIAYRDNAGRAMQGGHITRTAQRGLNGSVDQGSYRMHDQRYEFHHRMRDDRRFR